MPRINPRRLPAISPAATSGFSECEGCGKCCKNMPGAYVPDDFNFDVARMIAAIRRGVAQVDKWDDEGDDLGEVYFLRAPTVDAKGDVFEFSYGGRCALLEPNGCSLTYDERPRVCRGLVPRGLGQCYEEGFAKRDMVVLWKPLSDALYEAATKLEYANA